MTYKQRYWRRWKWTVGIWAVFVLLGAFYRVSEQYDVTGPQYMGYLMVGFAIDLLGNLVTAAALGSLLNLVVALFHRTPPAPVDRDEVGSGV